jgi:peptidoglycan/xylan/chitin deacetylase (PgdA/CDA1 family)
MNNMYDLIVRRNKKNKLKIFINILLLLLCIFAIRSCIVNKDKNNMNAYPNAIQVASQDFDVQIQAINNKEKEETIKNTRITTSQQVDNILNIYKNTGEKRVFLTFDDGPSKTVTPLILDLLKKENIKATFFLLGSRVEYNPDLVKRAYDEGHYIANHGYSHQYSSIYSSIDSILDEYNKTEQCIQKALGDSNYHSNLFRYPGGSNGGKYNKLKQEAKEVLKQNQIAYLDWNALSNDAAGAKTKEELINNIKSTVGGKSSVVILMHDASDKILTYETLPDVISFLREQGYKFETIYDII